jgi:hypothetical protein
MTPNLSAIRTSLNHPCCQHCRDEIVRLMEAVQMLRQELDLERLTRQRAEIIAKTVYPERTTP